MVLRLKVDNRWAERIFILLKSLCFRACEFKNALLRIGECDECTCLSYRFDYTPLICARILKFIQHDARESNTCQLADAVRGAEQLRYIRRKKTKADASVLCCEARSLGRFERLVFDLLGR